MIKDKTLIFDYLVDNIPNFKMSRKLFNSIVYKYFNCKGFSQEDLMLEMPKILNFVSIIHFYQPSVPFVVSRNLVTREISYL